MVSLEEPMSILTKVTSRTQYLSRRIGIALMTAGGKSRSAGAGFRATVLDSRSSKSCLRASVRNLRTTERNLRSYARNVRTAETAFSDVRGAVLAVSGNRRTIVGDIRTTGFRSISARIRL